jgi:hypothetical protein
MNYLRREGRQVTAYEFLDMPHHGESTSFSLEYAYYTGNAGFSQNNLVAINKSLTQRSRPYRPAPLGISNLQYVFAY